MEGMKKAPENPDETMKNKEAQTNAAPIDDSQLEKVSGGYHPSGQKGSQPESVGIS